MQALWFKVCSWLWVSSGVRIDDWWHPSWRAAWLYILTVRPGEMVRKERSPCTFVVMECSTCWRETYKMFPDWGIANRWLGSASH